ncbi:chorismate mutase [Pseudomonas sp. LPB0260]|uniref:chorismate mutase n=1 Tax=Pseudomonas sp. LPB0260 TaxID=2614442 RepID=UPI0015C296C3|nr:chorismate mutase [Pseudomonas sp. LPB0260]QLC72294.1 chorismate mutase [Pseudomonas sp. LPB0260]QLC75071.1 chorismate mutase [Pseudomonas sp. LPB0260]
MDAQCQSLAQVRANIDRIDRQLVTLLAERGRFVSHAAGFKRNTEEVRDGQRVEQVIAGVRRLAEELGANPDVSEAVYRAMINAFIQLELSEHSALTAQRP